MKIEVGDRARAVIVAREVLRLYKGTDRMFEGIGEDNGTIIAVEMAELILKLVGIDE